MENSKNYLAEVQKQKEELIQKKFNTQILDKISKSPYFKKDIDGLDITADTPEKAFSNIKYYQAMKEVPLFQKKALFFLVVCDYSLLQVSQMLNKTPSEILYLTSMAIQNFKSNLQKGGDK